MLCQTERSTWRGPRCHAGMEEFYSSGKQNLKYIKLQLPVGFDTRDFGSFVSAKAIPQMADTREVVTKLELGQTRTKLLAIVANTRGAEEAVLYDEIFLPGIPFLHFGDLPVAKCKSSINASLGDVERIMQICSVRNKQLVVYLSMAFGIHTATSIRKRLFLIGPTGLRLLV